MGANRSAKLDLECVSGPFDGECRTVTITDKAAKAGLTLRLYISAKSELNAPELPDLIESTAMPPEPYWRCLGHYQIRYSWTQLVPPPFKAGKPVARAKLYWVSAAPWPGHVREQPPFGAKPWGLDIDLPDDDDQGVGG